MTIATIPYTRQVIDQDDVEAVLQTLTSDFLTTGPKISEFEKKIAEFCGAKFCVVSSNGTTALHLANIALGYPKESPIFVPAVTFAATVNSILYGGGQPRLIDIDQETVSLSVADLNRRIATVQNPAGVINVHMGGLAADCEDIRSVADKNNMFVIEDACHSFGGTWSDRNGIKRTIGDCSFSDLCVFSFHPAKLLCTGEGGAVTTNDETLYKKMISFRGHGIERDAAKLPADEGPWYYEVQEAGHNFRLTDIQASLGLSQLKHVDNWIQHRRTLVARYDLAFADIPQVNHQVHPNGNYAYHLYIALVESRKELFMYLRSLNIFPQVHYVPIHFHPHFQSKLGVSKGDFPEAEGYYAKAISLPLFSNLTFSQQDRVIEAVRQFYR